MDNTTIVSLIVLCTALALIPISILLCITAQPHLTYRTTLPKKVHNSKQEEATYISLSWSTITTGKLINYCKCPNIQPLHYNKIEWGIFRYLHESVATFTEICMHTQADEKEVKKLLDYAAAVQTGVYSNPNKLPLLIKRGNYYGRLDLDKNAIFLNKYFMRKLQPLTAYQVKVLP